MFLVLFIHHVYDLSIHKDIHIDGRKTLKPTVANDPHAISSPSSKSFRVACAGRDCGMLETVESSLMYYIMSRCHEFAQSGLLNGLFLNIQMVFTQVFTYRGVVVPKGNAFQSS